MILYIDTTDFNKVTFGVGDGKNIFKKFFTIDPHKSHETLQKLEEFLKSSKYQVSSIKQIIANKGPGSYTGVRIGVTITQALGYAWNIKVKFLSKKKYLKF